MRKNSDINSFYYFNEVFDFNWFDVRMMCWVRIHVRISRTQILFMIEYFKDDIYMYVCPNSIYLVTWLLDYYNIHTSYNQYYTIIQKDAFGL